jgi:peptidoglycan/xylan/chitin deacetylase (PgdA/CDA1 family)
MTLVRDHFSPLPLAEGLTRLGDGTLPPRAVCITFDDGYADNLTVAAPILKRLAIPATVFVAGGYLDGKSMWNDRLCEAIRRVPGDTIDLTEYGCGVHLLGDPAERAKVVRHLQGLLKYCPPEHREAVATDLAACFAPQMRSPMLTRAQVRELRDQGVEIGGHTVTHPILARIEDPAAYREIAENKEDLEGLLGERVRFFAYPNGKPDLDFAAAHGRMARAIGYEAAVTTRPGVSTVATDPFGLPRFTPWERDPLRFGVRLLLNMRNIV